MATDASAPDDPSGTWVCPCRGPCKRCGFVNEDPEHPHPEDGLAFCPRCPLFHVEWWASSGPYMNGRCPADADELAEWDRWDARAMSGEWDGRPLPDPVSS